VTSRPGRPGERQRCGSRTLLVVSLSLLVGCAPQTPYRLGDQAVERHVVVGPRECPGRHDQSPAVRVAYVEIDEQGYFHDPDRRQLGHALELVDAGGRRTYVVVYVHGWQHNADPADQNVQQFKCALAALQERHGETVDVVGIYVGWRGQSVTLPGLQLLTFWDRKNTSDEVGRGSLVEFLGRLERTVKPTSNSPNRLVLVGHSFGASVVFNAIAPLLLERFILDAETLASSQPGPTHSQSKPGLVSGYGDLVVLVNPAIEATRIAPFFSALNAYTVEHGALLSPAQPARLVILSSEGDRATRLAFPFGRWFSTLVESHHDFPLKTPYGPPATLSQQRLDIQTMGNVTELYTHQSLQLHDGDRWAGTCPPLDPTWLETAIEQQRATQQRGGAAVTGAGWSWLFEGSGIEVRHGGATAASNPLWIMPVSTKLIPDHNSIAHPIMTCFLDQLVGNPDATARKGQQHLQQLRSGQPK
jgi:pimeloyl-ACP methyl ester carboxylesterase